MRSVGWPRAWIVGAAALVAVGCTGTTDPALPDGIAFVGIAASVDACETMPVITVQATRGGQVMAGYGGDVTIAVVTGTGVPGSVLSGTLTRSADAGVARFDDLRINASGSGYRLAFTAAGTAAGAGAVTTPAFNVIPGGPYDLAFTTSPVNGGVSLRLSPVRVTVRDACGSPAAGSAAPVTVGLHANSASASLTGATTTNAVDAVATFLDLTLNKPGPGFTLSATSPGLLPATSAAFTVAGIPSP